MREDGAVSRPKHNPPCRVAVDGLIDGYNSEGQADEPGAGVEKDVEKDEENSGQARCGEAWMRWNDFQETHRLHSTEKTSNILRHALTTRNIACVARDECARCGVPFTM